MVPKLCRVLGTRGIHPTTLKVNPITSMMDRNHRPGPPATPPDVIHHTLLES